MGMETAEADDAARITDESFILVVLVSGRGRIRKALGLVYVRVWTCGDDEGSQPTRMVR